jgi:hypothetical protein
MPFTGLILELETPLHIGAGRSGMLARGHGFVPGHVISYALTAALGKARGGHPAAFAQALTTVLQEVRCGPFLLLDPDTQRAWLPRQDREAIEHRYLTARTQVTLDSTTCSAVEGALFEVESLAARVLHGSHRGQPTQLIGGLWHRGSQLAGQPLQDWFRSGLLLGGELKTGQGRVKLLEPRGWMLNAPHYAKNPDWPVQEQGLYMAGGQRLPGPSLDGTQDAPLQPWLGRRFDPKQGFGRRFSPPALVRLDGVVEHAGGFLPSDQESGLGCWTRTHGATD